MMEPADMRRLREGLTAEPAEANRTAVHATATRQMLQNIETLRVKCASRGLPWVARELRDIAENARLILGDHL